MRTVLTMPNLVYVIISIIRHTVYNRYTAIIVIIIILIIINVVVAVLTIFIIILSLPSELYLWSAKVELKW